MSVYHTPEAVNDEIWLCPARILFIGENMHAFGRLLQSTWPQYRISSPMLSRGNDNGTLWVQTRSRKYFMQGLSEEMPAEASRQLREFLAAWRITQEKWPNIIGQLRSKPFNLS